VLFDQVTELVVAKTEVPGRLRAVAARSFKRVGEQLSFERGHFVVEMSTHGLEPVITEKADVLGRELVGRVAIREHILIQMVTGSRSTCGEPASRR